MKYIIITMFLLFVSCGKSRNNNENSTNKTENSAKLTTKTVETKSLKKSQIILQCPKSSSFYSIILLMLKKCKFNSVCMKNININKFFKNIDPEKLNNDQKSLLKVYVKAAKKEKLAILSILNKRSCPENWLDIFHQWLIQANDKQIKTLIYGLISKIDNKRSFEILHQAILNETNEDILKNLLLYVYHTAYADKLFSKTLLESMDIYKAHLILLFYSKLPKSDLKISTLKQCILQNKHIKTQCQFEFSKINPDNKFFDILEKDLENRNVDLYSIAAYWNYEKQLFFDIKKAKKLMYNIINDPKQKLFLRKAALGKIGMFGDSKDLEKLLKLSINKDLSDAIKRSQWRLRKKLKLPVVYKLPDLNKSTVKDKSTVKNKSTMKNSKN